MELHGIIKSVGEVQYRKMKDFAIIHNTPKGQLLININQEYL